MRPLAEWPREERAAIRGVLFDIDETLTTRGRLTPGAYAALAALHESGLACVPVTGRPAGWCDHIARMWPVDGVVGENGAFWFRHDRDAGRLVRRFAASDADRAASRARLDAIRARVLAEVRGAGIASDQPYREADLAIDFCEDVAPLPRASVERIVAIAREAGATAKVSSIHVNIWFGAWDKLTTARAFLREALGAGLDDPAERARWAFVGDSPNDAPMFGFFPHAVGVANVRAFAGRLEAEPAWVTEAESGAGFAELAAALLAARA
jgi:HAD superfamily hydrolase (TIGR01484 family)